MRTHCLLLLGLPLAGCASTKVRPTTDDADFMLLQENGRVRISSTSSAVQTRIIQQNQVGDTLLVTYRKGAFINRFAAQAHSIVQPGEQAKYVRCANRQFRVVKTGSGVALGQLP